jgi:hypothetical protein
MFVGQGFLAFERILRADYKPYLVQPTTLKKSLGNDQVPHMDGIETTEV